MQIEERIDTIRALLATGHPEDYDIAKGIFSRVESLLFGVRKDYELNCVRFNIDGFPRHLGKVAAIKLLRSLTGASLKEAKDFIESHGLWDNSNTPYYHHCPEKGTDEYKRIATSMGLMA